MLKRILAISLVLALFGVLWMPVSAGEEASPLTVWEQRLTFGEVLEIPSEWEGEPVLRADRLFSTPHPEVKKLILAPGIRAVRALKLNYLPSLTEIVLPDTLVCIHEGSFLGAAVSDITIPASVQLILEYNEYDVYFGVFSPGITLHGKADSYAARYAEANGLPFEALPPLVSPGDVNGDELCTTTDARLILQYASEKIPAESLTVSLSDVDGDGETTTTDARLTLQYTARKATVPAITAPVSDPDKPLISPNAKVELTRRSAKDLPEPVPVPDPAGAIAALNNILKGAYHSQDLYYCLRIEDSYCFTNPDGSQIILCRETGRAMELHYCDCLYAALDFKNPLWEDLYRALGE